nr:beta-galactosidase trimerization domain-containing protein [Paenibacillus dokdonensis]
MRLHQLAAVCFFEEKRRAVVKEEPKTDDFYAGPAALTLHNLGRGKAYYLAARAKEPLYLDFNGQWIQEAGVQGVWDTKERRHKGVRMERTYMCFW